jgi:hypothetical protein
MLSFKEFLLEVKNTPRQGLQQILKLSIPKFVELLKTIQDKYGGILSSDKLEIREKIDGSNFKFGLDENDDFFIETAYSGIVKAGEYVNTIKQKKGIEEVPDFVKYFNELSLYLKHNKKLFNLLKKQKEQNDLLFIKYIGEILYNPLGKEIENRIKFVAVEYDKSKLGNIATFVPIDVMADKPVDKNKLIRELIKISDKDLKIISNLRTDLTIDLSTDIKTFFRELEKKAKNWEEIIKSRKKKDAELRKILREFIIQFQEKIEDRIHELVGKGILGDNFEGLVLNIGGNLYKTQTKHFIENKKKWEKV